MFMSKVRPVLNALLSPSHDTKCEMLAEVRGKFDASDWEKFRMMIRVWADQHEIDLEIDDAPLRPEIEAARTYQLAIHCYHCLADKANDEWKNETQVDGRHDWTGPRHQFWLRVSLRLQQMSDLYESNASTMVTHTRLVNEVINKMDRRYDDN